MTNSTCRKIIQLFVVMISAVSHVATYHYLNFSPLIFSSLEKRRPVCQSALKVVTLDYVNSEGDHFLTNGLLKFNNEYYRTSDYCINGYDFKNPLIVMQQIHNN